MKSFNEYMEKQKSGPNVLELAETCGVDPATILDEIFESLIANAQTVEEQHALAMFEQQLMAEAGLSQGLGYLTGRIGGAIKNAPGNFVKGVKSGYQATQDQSGTATPPPLPAAQAGAAQAAPAQAAPQASAVTPPPLPAAATQKPPVQPYDVAPMAPKPATQANNYDPIKAMSMLDDYMGSHFKSNPLVLGFYRQQLNNIKARLQKDLQAQQAANNPGNMRVVDPQASVA